MTIKDVRKIEDENAYRYYDLREADHTINAISRAYIRAYAQKYGRALLVKTNEQKISEYKSGMVYNFACDLVVPYSEENKRRVADFLLQHPKNEIAKTYDYIKGFYDFCYSLGGRCLVWS